MFSHSRTKVSDAGFFISISYISFSITFIVMCHSQGTGTKVLSVQFSPRTISVLIPVLKFYYVMLVLLSSP